MLEFPSEMNLVGLTKRAPLITYAYEAYDGLAIANKLISLCYWLRCLARANAGLLHCAQLSLGDDSHQLIVSHVYGALELCGVLSAEGSWASITTVQESL